MPTFSTNPKWYNSAGVLDESLTGTAYNHNKCSNVAYGRLAEAGNDTGTTDGAVAIGDYARAFAPGSVSIGGRTDGEKSGALSVASGAISIGSSAQVTQLDGIVIGRDANASGGIAIGPGATTSGEMDIQLGNNNQAYTLSIGNKNQSAVCAGSYKIGENTVINNNRSISGNSLNINNKLNISSDGTVSSSKYIYTTDYVSAYSYRINNKAGSFTTVIDSNHDIFANNITASSFVATKYFLLSYMENKAYNPLGILYQGEDSSVGGDTDLLSGEYNGGLLPYNGSPNDLYVAILYLKFAKENDSAGNKQRQYCGFLSRYEQGDRIGNGMCVFRVPAYGNIGNSYKDIPIEVEDGSYFQGDSKKGNNIRVIIDGSLCVTEAYLKVYLVGKNFLG